MTDTFNDLSKARHDVSASSAGGAPFLIVFGVTLFVTAVLSFYVPERTAALIAMFQGGVALPLAFWLERRMGSGPMAPENPLRALSVQLAMSQIVALPVVILVFILKPRLVPVALAAVAGGHFLPYAWLQRTAVYAVLGVSVSVGAFVIQILLKAEAFPYVLSYMSAAYWVSAVFVYRNATRLVRDGVER